MIISPAPGDSFQFAVDKELYTIAVDKKTYVLTVNGMPLREVLKQYVKAQEVKASDEFLLRETNTKVVKGF